MAPHNPSAALPAHRSCPPHHNPTSHPIALINHLFALKRSHEFFLDNSLPDSHHHISAQGKKFYLRHFSLRYTVIYMTLDLQGKILTGYSCGNCQCADEVEVMGTVALSRERAEVKEGVSGTE